MKKRLLATLESLAGLVPLGIYPRIIRREGIDFFWHAVSDQDMPHVRHLYPVVPVAVFEAQLLYLQEHYNPVSYQQLHDHLLEGAPLPPRAVHLSFDDGYAECFSVVRPLLLEHGIPCTFFLTTGLVDNTTLFYRNKQSLVVENLAAGSFENLKRAGAAGVDAPTGFAAFLRWFKDLRPTDEARIDAVGQALGLDWAAFLAAQALSGHELGGTIITTMATTTVVYGLLAPLALQYAIKKAGEAGA